MGHEPPVAGNLGFVMLQFCMEADRPVLYLLELQLTEQCRGKGLGGFLMRQLDLIAKQASMQCVMLTVFKANEGALRFYEKLGYQIDETSPSKCGVATSSYEIMAKPTDSADAAKAKAAAAKDDKKKKASEAEDELAVPA